MCGIPNVGKSTFINTLAKRKAAQTGDKPGVTKALQWIKLDKAIELLDTPGVLWPKFEGEHIGEKLALLGAIRDEVVTQDDIAFYACEWLMKNDPEAFKKDVSNRIAGYSIRYSFGNRTKTGIFAKRTN